jgi:hypothetical protein
MILWPRFLKLTSARAAHHAYLSDWALPGFT